MSEQAAVEATNKVKVTIDGCEVEVDKGTTIFEAARQAGTEIPHYCYDKDLTVVASCRLCLVEIEKVPKLQPSCSTPVHDGQVIHTQSEQVLDARKMQMEFLLVQHPLDCPVCDQGGECKLQDYSRDHGFDETRFEYKRRTFPKPDIGSFIELERNRCILCTRCTRYMEEIAGNAELCITNRGNHAFISTFQDRPLKNEFAGNTIDLCPVGALTSKITRFRVRPWELKSAPSVCSMCSVGCNLNVQHRLRTNEVLRMLPRDNDDVNYRWLCDIGRFGFDQFNHSKRQRRPLLKDDHGALQPVKWSQTITETVNALKKTIKDYGADSVAGIIGPRASNETLWLFQHFMREAVGTNNIDHRTESAVENNDDGYITSLAMGAANSPFAEVKDADAILVLASDLPNELPILNLQVRGKAVGSESMSSACRPFTPVSVFQSEEKIKSRGQVIVAHSRPTRLDKDVQQTARFRPGAESAFLTALLHTVASEKGVKIPKSAKSAHAHYSLDKALEICGMQAGELSQTAKKLCAAQRPTILLGHAAFEGVHGADNVLMASALAEMLQAEGQCALPLSLLLLHNNSRGAADIGLYPHRNAGFQPVEKPGKNITEILQGCIDGSIKALVVFNTDFLNEYPDRDVAQKALETVPFLAVGDSYPYEHQPFANVFFPLSVYTEEDGTYTNVAGRVQRAQKALPQMDGTLSGYQLLLALGERWGLDWRQIDSRKLIVKIAGDVPQFAGMAWENLGALGSPAARLDGALFASVRKTCGYDLSQTKGIPPQGKSRLVRGRYLFDTAGEKQYAEAVVERSEPCVAEIHPDDAIRFGVLEGQIVKISGEKGAVELPVSVSPATFAGCVTILGNYESIPLNALATQASPWVGIEK